MTNLESLPQVLIFDDDEEMRSLIVSQIKSSDYGVCMASDYNRALLALEQSVVSLLITNSRIPEITLVEFLKRARAIRSPLTVLVLMNPGCISYSKQALEAGADDVLTRPFDRQELISKMRSLLKKNHPNLDRNTEKIGKLCFKELSLDTHSFDVFSNGERVKLTPNEVKLLHALLERMGETLSRDRLIELVQGEGVAVIDRAVDTHIFSLRKKLGQVGDSIETVRGEGYRIGATT